MLGGHREPARPRHDDRAHHPLPRRGRAPRRPRRHPAGRPHPRVRDAGGARPPGRRRTTHGARAAEPRRGRTSTSSAPRTGWADELEPRLLLHQVRLNQRSFWRNPESAFFSFAMPLGVLLIFGATSAHDTVPGRDDVDVLTLFVPGHPRLRHRRGRLRQPRRQPVAPAGRRRAQADPRHPARPRGVPRRPDPQRPRHHPAHLRGDHRRRRRSPSGPLPRAAAIPQLLVVLALGIACFAALGIAISAAIPTADAAGAITNGTYLPLAMVSGMFSASLQLPAAARHASSAPSRSRPSPTASDPPTTRPPTASPSATPRCSLVWTVAGIALARRFFRWNP